jgi:hypothetical protein
MKKTALALALLFVASVSRADQLYVVNGSLTIVGNDVCSGPCVETLNFSFDFSEKVDQFGLYELSIVPGTSSVVSFGPLGTFGAPAGPFGLNPGAAGNPSTNYIQFRSGSAAFSEIDIWASQNGLPKPFAPQIAGADLWACGTQACITDFCTAVLIGCARTAPPVYDIFLLGTVESEVTLVSAPEPGTLPLLGIAFSALLLLRIRSKCSRASSLKFFQ